MRRGDSIAHRYLKIHQFDSHAAALASCLSNTRQHSVCAVEQITVGLIAEILTPKFLEGGIDIPARKRSKSDRVGVEQERRYILEVLVLPRELGTESVIRGMSGVFCQIKWTELIIACFIYARSGALHSQGRAASHSD